MTDVSSANDQLISTVKGHDFRLKISHIKSEDAGARFCEAITLGGCFSNMVRLRAWLAGTLALPILGWGGAIRKLNGFAEFFGWV